MSAPRTWTYVPATAERAAYLLAGPLPYPDSGPAPDWEQAACSELWERLSDPCGCEAGMVDARHSDRICPRCGGSGRVLAVSFPIAGSIAVTAIRPVKPEEKPRCFACAGTGTWIAGGFFGGGDCNSCGGTGHDRALYVVGVLAC